MPPAEAQERYYRQFAAPAVEPVLLQPNSLRDFREDSTIRKVNRKRGEAALERGLVRDISKQSLVEQFRELNTSFFAPAAIGAFFGFSVEELAERAGVHGDTPALRPHAPRLQAYLQALVQVVTVATELTGDPERAAFLVRNEPLGALGHLTCDRLIQEGRVDDVVAYLQSFSGGSNG